MKSGILWDNKDAQAKGLSSLLVPEGTSIVCIDTLHIISGLVKKHLLHPNRNRGCSDCVELFQTHIHGCVRHNLCHHIHLLFVLIYHMTDNVCTLLIMALLPLKIIMGLKKGATT